MGGYGSGPSRRSSHPVAENYLRLDIAELRRAGMLARGYATSSMRRSWWRADRLIASAMIELDLIGQHAGWIVTHTLIDPDTGAESEPVLSKGWLTRTTPHLGGIRWWLDCGRCWESKPARVLYAPPNYPGTFRCRRCYSLRYASTCEGDVDRLVRRARKLWRRAGSDDGTEPWQKPRGMHWTTFFQLVLAGRAAQDRADEIMMIGLGRCLARIQGGRAA